MNSKRLLKFLLLFISLPILAQNYTIISTTTNTNDCVNSVNIEYDVQNHDSSVIQYTLLTSDPDESSSSNPTINSNGTYNTGIISMNQTTRITLIQTRLIFTGGFPTPIPVTLWSANVVSCQNDVDSDGVLNSNDDCPNIFGPASNNGCPLVDSDGDGIYDNQDDCPNEAGPASNNGCPQDYPDLVVDTQLSTALSSGANTSTVSFSNNITHQVYLGQELQINLSIKNQGDETSGHNIVGVYLSNNNSFASASLIDQINFNSSINENQNISRSFSLSNSTLSQYANSSGNVYVHFKLDKDNDVNEGDDGGEDNNIYSSVKAKSYNTVGRSFPKTIINLNNFSSKVVNNEDELNAIMINLDNGFYVIKSSNGNTLKIIKNYK